MCVFLKHACVSLFASGLMSFRLVATLTFCWAMRDLLCCLHLEIMRLTMILLVIRSTGPPRRAWELDSPGCCRMCCSDDDDSDYGNAGELDEVNGKLATSDRMLSHMQKYLGKVDAELQTIGEKLEVETYGRAELEELQKSLLQERAEIKARIDAEVKNSNSLVQVSFHSLDSLDRSVCVRSIFGSKSSPLWQSRDSTESSIVRMLIPDGEVKKFHPSHLGKIRQHCILVCIFS